jgi:hypothetical protein
MVFMYWGWRSTYQERGVGVRLIVSVSSQNLDFQRHMSWSFSCVRWVNVRGDTCFLRSVSECERWYMFLVFGEWMWEVIHVSCVRWVNVRGDTCFLCSVSECERWYMFLVFGEWILEVIHVSCVRWVNVRGDTCFLCSVSECERWYMFLVLVELLTVTV